MVNEYLPILVLIIVGLSMGTLFTLLSVFLGPSVRNKVKEQPFECGNLDTGSSHKRVNVKFYMTAMIFLIFDVEIIFLYPWAVKFREMGWFGFFEVMVFFVILVLALFYVWKKGALEWE